MRPIHLTCGGHRLQSPRQEAKGKEDLEKTLRLQGSANHSIKNECEENSSWLVFGNLLQENRCATATAAHGSQWETRFDGHQSRLLYKVIPTRKGGKDGAAGHLRSVSNHMTGPFIIRAS
jgi:hypothetical protein